VHQLQLRFPGGSELVNPDGKEFGGNDNRLAIALSMEAGSEMGYMKWPGLGQSIYCLLSNTRHRICLGTLDAL
jgi:hypothetical protein